ncbi:MAG: glycosyltransferase family 39 protein [bacterium]
MVLNFWSKYKKWINLFILLVILVYASILRFEYFVYFKDLPLEADAQGFFNLAHQPTGFYGAGIREPVIIFLAKIGISIFGDQAWVVRLWSLVFSLLLVLAVYFIGQAIFNEVIGLGAALVTGITPILIQSSTRGLRTEAYAVFLLVFIYFLFVHKKYPLLVRLIITGVTGGILALLRLEAILTCVLLLIYFFLTEGKQVLKEKLYLGGKVILAVFIMTLVVAPFLINNYRAYGDSFYSQNAHATFWRNQEFASQAGFPSIEEVNKNGYAGVPVTTFAYIFKMHTAGEIILRYIQGYVFSVTKYLLFILAEQLWLSFLGLIGLVLLLFSPYRYLSVTFLVALLPVAFILPLNTIGHRGVDIRFILHIYPLFILAMLYPLLLAYKSYASKQKNKKTGSV